jgi:predicted deacylase
MLYEAGEALRFDEWAIRHGLLGIVSAMQHLEMVPFPKRRRPPPSPLVARKSHWVRAQTGGVLRPKVRLGDMVDAEQVVGRIGDPFGREEVVVRADRAGMVVGQTNLPLVNEGDALFLVALVDETTAEFEPVDPFDVERGGLALDPAGPGDDST